MTKFSKSIFICIVGIIIVSIIWTVFNRSDGFDDINPKYANRFQTDSQLTSSRFLVTANSPTVTRK